MKSIFENLELIFKRFATKLGDSRADETDSFKQLPKKHYGISVNMPLKSAID